MKRKTKKYLRILAGNQTFNENHYDGVEANDKETSIYDGKILLAREILELERIKFKKYTIRKYHVGPLEV